MLYLEIFELCCQLQDQGTTSRPQEFWPIRCSISLGSGDPNLHRPPHLYRSEGLGHLFPWRQKRVYCPCFVADGRGPYQSRVCWSDELWTPGPAEFSPPEKFEWLLHHQKSPGPTPSYDSTPPQVAPGNQAQQEAGHREAAVTRVRIHRVDTLGGGRSLVHCREAVWGC